jgi:hypothetical protein
MGAHAVFRLVVNLDYAADVSGETAMRRVLAILAFVVLASASQVSAQVDLSGTWAANNSGHALDNRPAGPRPVEYQGIPLNEFGRSRALIFSQSMFSMPDRICALYTPVYLMLGPFGLKIWNETEPHNGGTVAWHIGGWEDMAPITIWMDGRRHPSKYAPHEVGGFTTGVWKDDVLVAQTTHMRAGFVRRSGAPISDQAVMTTRFFRHSNRLTVTGRVEDPIYLAEPMYLTRVFELSEAAPSPSVGTPCIPDYEGVPEGVVPHYLPGKNPFVDELTKTFNIPLEAVLGGPETMYPDIRRKLRTQYAIPPRCQGEACGPAPR